MSALTTKAPDLSWRPKPAKAIEGFNLQLFALFTIVAVPWPLSESGLASTQVAHYNRWGWALLATLLLFGLPAGAGEQGARHPQAWAAVESAAIAALLSLLFFLKATYFSVGLVFVLLFGVAGCSGASTKNSCPGTRLSNWV